MPLLLQTKYERDKTVSDDINLIPPPSYVKTVILRLTRNLKVKLFSAVLHTCTSTNLLLVDLSVGSEVMDTTFHRHEVLLKKINYILL